MGTVYAAAHSETGQKVAVKALWPAYSEEEAFRARFMAEIESLGKLRHPGIVRLLGHGEEGEYLFYAMEHMGGGSLEDQLAAGHRLDWRRTTVLAIQVCGALKHAHDHGIVHRDLKPANLLLDERGEVKLSDFGIARLFGARMTREGGVIGTAEYMAPEQADGSPATHRADLYSLGCVMYALMSGKPPFSAASFAEMLQLHRTAQPESLGSRDIKLPTELEAIVGRLLSKDPADRFPDAAVLERELTSILQTASPDSSAALAETPPAPHGKRAAIPRKSSLETIGVGNSGGDSGEPTQMEKRGDVDRGQPRETHFTEVDPDKRPAEDEARASGAGHKLQIVLLAAALVGVIAAAVYFSRGPTLDEQFDRLAATVEDDDALLMAERDISRLVAELPEDDPRRERLKQWSERIELLRDDRRIRRGLKRGSLAPPEQLYAEAVTLLTSDPQHGVRRLRALIDLYDLPDATDPTARRCIELARHQLEAPQGEARVWIDGRLAVLEDRLTQARKLSESDPKRAGRICHAIIEQYAADPWADAPVEQAREMLRKIE